MTAAQASIPDDEKAVAALDTEYQAAVEKNDAATTGRILADDMILVTGRGKVFTREDLLKSAREASRLAYSPIWVNMHPCSTTPSPLSRTKPAAPSSTA
jgi:Domain of unknown function (DUF4440)